ncbi:unnamed protein product [Acanthoscelides obtectus]|uniref:Uncharacterized protein n=1 Tax=Acanthoscelides obtectus TaxID=200917 RepID=A0A9P0KJT5_ACAOB|nr:unnamed protein product [Acanthoscelides obtectus]CAK1685457.1 hypothetical protein AOBTE_LOCUS35422 [Acanthoscelides obtectus]
MSDQEPCCLYALGPYRQVNRVNHKNVLLDKTALENDILAAYARTVCTLFDLTSESLLDSEFFDEELELEIALDTAMAMELSPERALESEPDTRIALALEPAPDTAFVRESPPEVTFVMEPAPEIACVREPAAELPFPEITSVIELADVPAPAN